MHVTTFLDGARADVDSRCSEGKHRTPLFCAAEEGHVEAVKELLRARANPLLACTTESGATAVLQLVIAAQYGHFEVVGEMVLQLGVEGCGGASNGIGALSHATVLVDAGADPTSPCQGTGSPYDTLLSLANSLLEKVAAGVDATE
eukprot:g13286.t1